MGQGIDVVDSAGQPVRVPLITRENPSSGRGLPTRILGLTRHAQSSAFETKRK
jgi:hypothetical protein